MVVKYLIRLCLVAYGVFLSCEGNAQVGIPDSIHHEAGMQKTPEKRADFYLEYINTLAGTFPDSAIALEDALIRYYEEQHFIYGVARAKSLKAWHLGFQSKYEESLRLGHEALIMQKSISDSLGVALTLNRIGIANLQFKRYRSAQDYLLQALQHFEKLNDNGRVEMVLNNMGVSYSEEKNYKAAIRYYKRSLNIRIARNDPFWIAYSYFNIGGAYLKANNIDSAQRYLWMAYRTFKDKTTRHKVPAMVYLGMASLFQAQDNYDDAIRYAKKGLSDAEKAHHVEMIVEGKKLLGELLYESGKYKEAYSMHQNYEHIRNRLDSINSAARVAEIEEQYKNKENEARLAALTNEKLEAENNAQQFKLYLLVALVMLMLLVFGIVILWLRRNQKQQIQRSELNAKISEVRMVALKAQMNPHFIFNSINTAQSFVMNDQKERAYEYLSNFARLLRMVLDNSSKVFIPLEDEIAQLKLYIELEETRFINTFSYEFNVDPYLENGIYEIPGMILQPLIENAIGHGLINRNDDKGRLTVKLKPDGENIQCTIEDNGVGREKAREIKSMKKINHQSAALPNINERLKMLQNQTQSIIDIQLVDLFENGSPSGTMVSVVLPYK